MQTKPDRTALRRLLRDGDPGAILTWCADTLKWCLVNRELAPRPGLQKDWARFSKCCALARSATYDGERQNAIVAAVRAARKLIPLRYQDQVDATPASAATVKTLRRVVPVRQKIAVTQMFSFGDAVVSCRDIFNDPDWYDIVVAGRTLRVCSKIGRRRRIITVSQTRPVWGVLCEPFKAAYLQQTATRAEAEVESGRKLKLGFASLEKFVCLMTWLKGIK